MSKYIFFKPFGLVLGLSILALVSCEKIDENELDTQIQNETSQLKSSSNSHFEIGLQFCDWAKGLHVGYTDYASSNSSAWTDWMSDDNFYDPDGIRVMLQKDVIGNIVLKEDFRIVGQATDKGTNSKYEGTPIATPWASQGGGWSLGYITDNNSYAPDAYRLKIETRPWPSSTTRVVDFKVGVRLYRLKGGKIVPGDIAETNYLNQDNGGNSDWCFMNKYFDGIKFNLIVRREKEAEE